MQQLNFKPREYLRSRFCAHNEHSGTPNETGFHVFIYRSFDLYPATCEDRRGNIYSIDETKFTPDNFWALESYGIFVQVYEQGLVVDSYDSGPLSAVNAEANWLFHSLASCRYKPFTALLDDNGRLLRSEALIEVIKSIVTEQVYIWSDNEWADPFGEAASSYFKGIVQQYRDKGFFPPWIRIERKRRSASRIVDPHKGGFSL